MEISYGEDQRRRDIHYGFLYQAHDLCCDLTVRRARADRHG
jgi:hypothetical protein